MGCDIHLFIEYKRKDGNNWTNFGEKFRLDRDYRMFAMLAGVRAYGDEIKPISESRGLPDNIAWKTRDNNRFYILGEDEEVDGDRQVTRSKADSWVKSGASQYEDKNHVTHPDWHSHSWLTNSEYETCVNSFEDVDTDYKAVLAASKCLEDHGYDVRIVFWFDN